MIKYKPLMVDVQPSRGKVFLLRHEQRGSQISFDTSLTPRGLENAEKIVCPNLEQLNIGVIYSSPFIRTIQTVKPFCDKTGKKINLEWSLVESYPGNIGPYDLYDFNSIINPNYVSFTPFEPSTDSSLLSFESLKQRIKPFIESLDRSQNILLVTHMPVINAILSYKGLQYIEMYTHHQPGALLSMSGDNF